MSDQHAKRAVSASAVTDKQSTFAGGLRRRWPVYRVFLTWFAIDLWRHFGGRMIAIAVTSVIGNTGQIAAFGVGLLYLRALESGETISVQGFAFSVDNSIHWLVGTTALAITILIFSGAIELWARRSCNWLAWTYSDICSRRLFERSSVSCDWPLEREDCPSDARSLTKLSFKECRLLGIGARLLAFGLLHLAGLPIAFIALAWLDVSLTLLVVMAAMIGIGPYYFLSMRGAMFRRRLERYGRKARQERRGLADRVLSTPGRIERDDADLVAAFDQGASYHFGEAFAEQRNVMEVSTFASQVVIGLALGLVIIIGGAEVLSGGGTWSGLLAFLLVLRFAGMKLIGAVRVLVSINRFYPDIRRYADIIKSFDSGAVTQERPDRALSAYTLIAHNAENSEVELEKDKPIGFLLPVPVTRPHLAILHRHLRLREKFASPANVQYDMMVERLWIAVRYRGQSVATLRTVLGFPSDLTTGALMGILQDYGFERQRAKKIADRLDCPVDARTRRNLDPNATFILSLISGELAEAQIIAAPATDLARSRKAWSKFAERIPPGTAMVAAASDLQALERVGVRQVLVSDGTHLLDVRTLAEVRDDSDLTRLMADAREASQRRADALNDDDDDEMAM